VRLGSRRSIRVARLPRRVPTRPRALMAWVCSTATSRMSRSDHPAAGPYGRRGGTGPFVWRREDLDAFLRGDKRWVTRWRYQMAKKSSRRGIWRLKGGGFFVRGRVTDPRTGKEYQIARVVPGMQTTLRDALRVQDQLRSEVRERLAGRIQSRPLWSEFAASLFEAKVVEGKLKSPKSQERWSNTLARLIPAFGRIRVDDLRYADLESWREQIARWIRDGMPSVRKRDQGKLIKLSPVTANGWISILKVICTAMARRFELPRDPGKPLEYFPVGRTYTREQPNAVEPQQMAVFLARLKELYPQHYAMTLLGFAIGARPSTLRPLRRRGPEPDKHDQELPLPPAAMRVLRAHVEALPPGPMRDSDLLFPATHGGLRTRSVLDKPFRRVLKALDWNLKLTPKGMRRTFYDLARRAEIDSVVRRAIAGHLTASMKFKYSTAQIEEMRSAVGKVISIATARQARARRARKRL
jgi:hypothetical protein